MIKKFATVYAGHVDLPDRGQDATPANERRFSNAHLASVFDKTEAIARVMDEGGWDTLWMAEHHFQQEGYEVIPNLLMAAVHLCHLTKTPQDRLRLQHRADVASAAAGRGFRLRRHHDQGAHHLRRRPRLPYARGGNLRRADDRPERQSRAVRGAGRDHLQGVRQRAVLAQGQALHAAARSAVSRLHAEGPDLGAASGSSAGGVLAAGGQRIGARARLHGEAQHQGRGRWWCGDPGAGADHRIPGGGASRRQGLEAGREPDDRHRHPPGRFKGAGAEGDCSALRGARQDVCAARASCRG